MCDKFGWDNDDYEMREARRKFKSAMVQQFNDLYGTDKEDLISWQKLCHILNIEPVPEELKKCREVRICFNPFIIDRWLNEGWQASSSDACESCGSRRYSKDGSSGEGFPKPREAAGLYNRTREIFSQGRRICWRVAAILTSRNPAFIRWPSWEETKVSMISTYITQDELCNNRLKRTLNFILTTS